MSRETLPLRRTSLSPSLFSPPYLSLSLSPTGSLFAALYTRAFLNQVGDGDKDTTKASNNNKRQLYWFLPTHTYTDTKTDRQADTRIDTYKTYLLRRCVCVRTAVYSSESQHVCMCVRWGSQNPIDSCLLRNVSFAHLLYPCPAAAALSLSCVANYSPRSPDTLSSCAAYSLQFSTVNAVLAATVNRLLCMSFYCCCSFALHYILTSLYLELSLPLFATVCALWLPLLLLSIAIVATVNRLLCKIRRDQRNAIELGLPLLPSTPHPVFVALLTKSALAMAKAVWGFFLLCLGLSSTSSSTSTSSLTWTCVDFYQARDKKKSCPTSFLYSLSVCVCFLLFLLLLFGAILFRMQPVVVVLLLALALALFLYWFPPLPLPLLLLRSFVA